MGWTNVAAAVIEVVTVIIVADEPGAGIFLYNGPPENGDLIGSLAAAAGTDAYGNSYPEGFKFGGVGGTAAVVISVGADGKTGLIYFPGIVPNIENDAHIQLNQQGTGSGQYSFLTIASAEDNSQQDIIAASWAASSHDGTQVPTLTIAYQDPSSAVHNMLSASLAGLTGIGTFTAPHPGTGTSRTNVATAETWQTPSYQTGWAGGGATQVIQPLQYRLSPDGTVQLLGAFHATNGAPSGVIATVSSDYIPSEIQKFPAVIETAGAASAAFMAVDTSGNIQIAPTPASGADAYVCCNYRIV